MNPKGLGVGLTSHTRVAASVLAVCAILAVQLYIYSPWHQHPQGWRYCNFNPVEQSNCFQESSQAAIAPPVVTCCCVVDELTPVGPSRHIEQLPSRAPPA